MRKCVLEYAKTVGRLEYAKIEKNLKDEDASYRSFFENCVDVIRSPTWRAPYGFGSEHGVEWMECVSDLLGEYKYLLLLIFTDMEDDEVNGREALSFIASKESDMVWFFPEEMKEWAARMSEQDVNRVFLETKMCKAPKKRKSPSALEESPCKAVRV